MSYQKILVGLDGSAQAARAFTRACELATVFSAELFLLHVVNRDLGMETTLGVTEDVYREREERVREKMTPLVDKAIAQGITARGDVLVGNVRPVIAHEYPAEKGIDLIVLGDTGLNSLEKVFIGSVSSYVLRNAEQDVLIVK